LDGTRGDFHIFAFGEEIAYKRMFPVTLRTASAWVLPGIELPPPLALAILAALGLASLGFVAVRRDWAPGLREDPVLAAFSLCLVVVLVVPPLPARAGGGGGNVLYRRWILADPLGSATVILEANPVEPSETQEGRAEREVVYKPFGDIHEDAGSQGMDTGIFAGHPLEPTTGLHYMRARWQNPKTGSFLSVDPLVGAVADPQSYNGYSYARSNPLSHLDPTGMDCSSAAAASCSMYVSETGHNYTVTITYLDSTLSEALAAGWAAIGSSASSGLTSIGLSGFSGLGGPGLGLGPGPIGPSFALPGGGGPGLTAAPSSQSGGGGESPWIAAGAAVGVLAADDVTGVGAVNDLLIPVVLAGAATYDLTQRTFITYTLTNPVGQAYVGRASGFGTPQSILNRRLSTHHATALGFGAPTLDRAVQGAQGYPAIRGREQQLIDSFGGVGSPNVGNAIRGVSRFNPLGRVYHGASDAYFGPLAPYTGY
jgi:RHS repeat-associated protein